MLSIIEKVFTVLGVIETGLIVGVVVAVIYKSKTFKTEWRGNNGIQK